MLSSRLSKALETFTLFRGWQLGSCSFTGTENNHPCPSSPEPVAQVQPGLCRLSPEGHSHSRAPKRLDPELGIVLETTPSLASSCLVQLPWTHMLGKSQARDPVSQALLSDAETLSKVVSNARLQVKLMMLKF